MCFIIHFSTTSEEDFSKVGSPHFGVVAPDVESFAEVLSLLEYPHCWNLMCRHGGCSCHYRHELCGRGFGPVESWYSEEADDIESTGHVYDFFRRILDEGHRLDVIDAWHDALAEEIETVEVELHDVPRDHFRFLVDYRLAIKA